MTIDLANGVDAKNELTATFTLLDAVHSDIKVTLDVAGAKGDDYTSGLVDEKAFSFPAGSTAKITDFVKVISDPFSYTIMNADGEAIYQADPIMLMKEGLRYALSVSHIETNRLHQTPIFGLGQRNGPLKVPQMDAGVHTFWNANGNGRSNGYQPFYLFENHDTTFVGVFDLSTYPFDYIVDNDRARGEALITQVLTGGPMVKYIFGAQKMTPPQIIARYQMLVGAPAVPPDWAFGWQHAKDGVVTAADWKKIADNYATGALPLDALWATVDTNEDFKTFTVSKEKYPDIDKVITGLHKSNIHVVPAVESGISMVDGTNPAWTTASGKNVFITSADKKAAVGRQFGNKVAFPDFTSATAASWWMDNLSTYQKSVAFDGIWLDRNEMDSECSGYCYPDNMVGVQVPAKDIEAELPYVPGDDSLDSSSLDLNAQYASGANEFELHNKFAFMQSMETAKSLKSVLKTKPFVMSRSSISGQGKYSSTYSGENMSSWQALEQSVHDLYLASTYGMPFHGSDVCGFAGDQPSAELCTRWYILAATQPFARNAASYLKTDQAPYMYVGQISAKSFLTYSQLLADVMMMKYSFLRYTVSSFEHIHQMGGVYYSPLFYHYPND